MAERLRVAIVGAGIGAAHLEGYLANPARFTVPVVCDLDANRAAALCAKAGAAHVASYAAVLARDDLDIIDICLPPMLHQEAIVAALASGRHVICEKPLVNSLRAVDAIEEAQARHGRAVVPVFQYRFGQGLGQLRHLIGAGLAGTPFVASLETHWHRPEDYYAIPWRGKWASELGGAIVSHAIHIHDLLVGVLGPIRAVQAKLATRVNRIEVEDCAAIILQMASGALVTSSVTLGAANDTSRLRFCFQHLTAESGTDPYNPATLPWRFLARAPMAQARIAASLADCRPHSEGYARLFELTHTALIEGGTLPVSLADARASLELITAIYQADATGRAVELPLQAEAAGYGGWMPAGALPG